MYDGSKRDVAYPLLLPLKVLRFSVKPLTLAYHTTRDCSICP